MNTTDRSSATTREKLLEAACVAFAEKGFRDATVADICEAAGANIASVNYYFGSKETLYVEAWRLAFQRSIDEHPPGGGVPEDAPAAERLHGHVRSLLERAAGPRSYEFDIVHKELANPTGLLKEVMRECVGPIRRRMGGIVRELLGPRASERDVRLCQVSIAAQCMHPLIRCHKREHPGAPLPEDCAGDFDIDALVEHIVTFSLAGLEARRRQIEQAQAGEGK
jgi:AcrR family transcriptional regulator